MNPQDWNQDPRWQRAFAHHLHLAGRRGHGRGHRHGFGDGPPFGVPPGPPFGQPPFVARWLVRRGGRMKRGDVRAGILALLAEEPRNGYQIMQELETRSRGMWRPSPGSVYPALQLLEDEGLVRAETGAGGRVFALTEAGRKHVDEQGARSAPWEAAAGTADPESLELFRLTGQLGAAAMQVAHTGSAAQIAEARKALIAARRALYRILADDDGGDE